MERLKRPMVKQIIVFIPDANLTLIKYNLPLLFPEKCQRSFHVWYIFLHDAKAISSFLRS